ncbi:hypothetical protein NEOLEDRAFT_1101239 [Neolentinus lepideus HHB14362 ss-1]|uniref:Ser-Thr-rich glycosyl-phosphatidyl-inositol-anchored membrane family-domain-containing protein n=1 Tax=Neolentinus lepideus HHB14362 ss-1 TaxID=1314782 RepID=A0A165NV62_9AGAM|nr:hypothetical protein NEOLEDRAFT_1101239 [Neolentinus lepideus HHB14362 ss-1]
MKFFAVLAVASVLAGALGQTFQINTPYVNWHRIPFRSTLTLTSFVRSNVVVCEPILFTWSGGTGALKSFTHASISILPGGQPSAAALVNLGEQQGTSYTWTVTQPAGTSLGLTLRDSSGETVQSAPFTVLSGTDSSCLNGSSGTSSATASSSSASSVSASSSASSASASSSSGSTPAASTTGSVTSTASSHAPSSTSPSSASHSSAPSASASTTSSSASPARVAQLGAAGLVGALVAAVIA